MQRKKLNNLPVDLNAVVWKNTNKETGKVNYGFNFSKSDEYKEGEKHEGASGNKSETGYTSEVVKVLKHDMENKDVF